MIFARGEQKPMTGIEKKEKGTITLDGKATHDT